MPALDVRTADSTDPANADDQAGFVVEVRSVGTATCTNVTLHYQIPKQMEFVSATGSGSYKVEDNIVKFDPHPLLSPGQRTRFQIVCKVIGSGVAIQKATVTYDQFETPITIEEATTCVQ